MELPDRSIRPRAFDFDTSRYQWRTGRAPERILKDGREIPNPFYRCALFVVHGIGDQQDTDTAIAMRWGVEDALPRIDPKTWARSSDGSPGDKDRWILPAPYINDGHWAQYDDLTTFSEDLGGDLDVLTSRQTTFFTNLWRARARGWFRSWVWIVAQGLKLVRSGTWWKKPFYLLLTLLIAVVLFAAGVWPRSRKFVVTYVNDARLYLEPHGDIEHETVHLIDRRVARGFLKTLGLDMNFEPIEDYAGVLLSGRPHKFDRVVWAAHSLGTIISSNVIGDLLHQCIEIRKKYATDNGGEYTGPCPKAERVEKALAGFVTFGSPLDKICFLYRSPRTASERGGSPGRGRGNNALRRWPEEYLPGKPLDIRKPSDQEADSTGNQAWWTNVFYGSDPISGPLDSIEQFLEVPEGQRLIHNISTFGLRPPLMSHVGYWRDPGLVAEVLTQIYAGYTKRVVHKFFRGRGDKAESVFFVRSWPRWTHGLLSAFGLFWITVGSVAAIAYVWINWDTIGPWIKGITQG